MKRKYKKNILNLKKQFSLVIKLIILLFSSFILILYLISQPLDSSSNEMSAEELAENGKEEFLLELSPYAQELSTSHGIRPSLLLAQAALESNWGNSQLAEESNNYFGIKSKEGKEYLTKEFRQGEWQEVKSTFKEYDSVYDSILDYADLLKNGTSWNGNLYQEVVQASNYEEAARALTKAGYATDPSYAEKIIGVIEQYQLNELDH